MQDMTLQHLGSECVNLIEESKPAGELLMVVGGIYTVVPVRSHSSSHRVGCVVSGCQWSPTVTWCLYSTD